LSVSTLTEGVHSGAASGVVPSSFRVLRQVLSRLEDERTGDILPPELHADIPTERLGQAAHRVLGAGAALGDDDAELLAVVHAAVAVGGHHGAALLPEHDGADAFLGHFFNEIIGREACHPFNALRFQKSRNGLQCIHPSFPPGICAV